MNKGNKRKKSVHNPGRYVEYNDGWTLLFTCRRHSL